MSARKLDLQVVKRIHPSLLPWWMWAGCGFEPGTWDVPCRIVEIHVDVDSLENDSPTRTGGVVEQTEFTMAVISFQRLRFGLGVASGEFDFFRLDVPQFGAKL